MLDLIAWLKKPFAFLITIIASFFTPLFPLVSLIVGAMSDPGGAVNSFICRLIDVAAYPFPTSPDAIKVSTLVTGLGNAMPLVGSAILFDFMQTFVAVMLIYAGVKIYKLLPFKMS